MKTFKLTAEQVSEKYFGEDVDIEIMKDEQSKIEKSISKMNKIISSAIDEKLTLTIIYEPLPPVVMP